MTTTGSNQTWRVKTRGRRGIGPAALLLSTLLLAGALALPGRPARAGTCLPLGSQVVLVGTLSRRVFPGPPNYRDIQHGDRPESGWFIDLDTPVCVADLSNLSSFQLMVLPLTQTQGARYLGRRAWVTGTLFRAATRHQHTPVLMQVTGIGGQ